MDANEQRLQARVDEQERYCVRATAPLQRLVIHPGHPDGARERDCDESGWSAAGPGTSWGGAEEWAWFRATFQVPDAWAGRRVRLALPLGGQGMIYLDGEPWQGRDEYHTSTELPARFHDGQPHLAAIEAYAAGAITAPRRPDERFVLGDCCLQLIDEDAEGLYYDLLLGVEALRALAPTTPERAPLLNLLLAAENLVDRRRPGSDEFYASCAAARAVLRDGLPALASGSGSGRPKVLAVGHAHIDTAWLWTLAQTRRKVARSWSTALRLMERFPHYRFLASQPQQYRWLEEDEPELYRQVVERVREGRWEPAGAMWVEPDVNLTSGESLVRQFLYGQRYLRERFGRTCGILWLPDAFGYSGALPQLMRSAGVHTFVTTKLSWNTVNRMPHDTFRWRGIDGSEVLGYFITAGIDARADSWASDPDAPQRFSATYNGHMTAFEVLSSYTRYRDKQINQDTLYSFGWGDGGGGPTEKMLQVADRLADYPGMPPLSQDSAERFLGALRDRVWDHPRTETWEGELYLEYHRGTYTSQAGVKWGNRRGEHVLHDAELWVAWAGTLGTDDRVWRERLTGAWELLLLNQFHDILPGSSIAEVYADQARQHAEVTAVAAAVSQEAQQAIAASLAAPKNTLAVFNSLPWAREDLVLEQALPEGLVPQGEDGAPLPVQVVENLAPAGSATLIGGLRVPALGYRTVRLIPPALGQASDLPELSIAERVLENRYFRLELDGAGRFDTLLDKRHNRQVLAPGGGGNRLLAFEDKPLSYDAWDIDSFYTEKPREIDDITEWCVVESGPLRGGVEIVRRWGASTIRQRILLHAETPRIDIQTAVDWHERQVLLKAAFPLAVHGADASYECAFGHLRRPTHRNTSWDAARFEVAGHRWADLSETGYGVSLLNDGKYGHDCLGNVLRLTLLKSAIMPDPLADEGPHTFSYALYPHGPAWTIADTVRAAYAFNLPASSQLLSARQGTLPGRNSLVSTESAHAVIDTVKPAEDGDGLIVRVYECTNARGPVSLRFNRPVRAAQAVTILEEPDEAAGSLAVRGDQVGFDLLPFQVRSFRVCLAHTPVMG